MPSAIIKSTNLRVVVNALIICPIYDSYQAYVNGYHPNREDPIPIMIAYTMV